ncbi:hypothetical protein KIMH_13700 [Bombiscardovia apis]|uniref:Extracellular endo-alpha-(1->5)-L-arabinanase C-terminal domain-containing protein n=1 Tax=Bombiscardovia apis TaxID=2932182 RepID=A0ABM8BEA3_9BIFI|nr:family 43 glycosylhydrolase [Bombiscardovia apis]BDR55259.1 hypothetical protein KIMH_13700 [Bombiscardovia apis]
MRHISNYRKGISPGKLKAAWMLAWASCLALALAFAMLAPSALASQTSPRSGQPLPAPIVDYNFASLRAGDQTLANSGSEAAIGSARLLNAQDGAASAVLENGALAMQGDYYVKLPDGLLAQRSSVTISTVVKNDTFNASGPWTYLWSLGGTGQANQGSWATSTHTSLYTSITSHGNGAGETFFSASQNLSIDEYQTLTATIDGSTNEVTLYLDGSKVGSARASVNPAQFGNHTHNVIGQSRYPGVGDGFFHGSVKSFAVFDQALTPEQVAESLPAEGVSRLLASQLQELSLPASAQTDFALPASTAASQLQWTSSNPAAVSIDSAQHQARVHQSSQDQRVELTVSAQPLAGMAQPVQAVTRTFEIVIPQRVDADGLAAKVADAVQIDGANDVRGDFLLPTTLSLPAYQIEGTIAWKSANSKALSVEGPIAGSQNVAVKVQRPDCGDAISVALTATVSAANLPRPVTKQVNVSVQPLSAGADTSHTRVSSHDPSIVKANGKYYVFGSHRAWARSTDLKHWEPFTNNLSTDYENVFAAIWNAWPKQASNPDVAGNMWAPEVIWNKSMGKWCMYMSINGGGFPYQKSVMVLLTADDIEGDWTYVGPVIYSGFQASNVNQTDVPRVLGANADLTRYSSLEDTGLNMIDACVKYDDNGDMWMSFGSWFGGIWMIKLDPATGLRDYSTNYPTQANVSDAYYGHKLAGGFGNSGEGSALVKQGEWWYLMLSYGGLTQTGGYQMREFRSRSITGPYLDQNGNSAVYTRKLTDDKIVNRGLRIMSSVNQPGQHEAMTAQGGNAVLTDDDGAVYNVYHSRFVRTSGNLEEHQVRVNQMMTTADGWLVSSPYEYSQELGAAPSADLLPGEYEIAVHDPTSFYTGGAATAAGVYQARKLELKADGSLGGIARGTWKLNGSSLEIQANHAAAASKIHGHYVLALATQVDEYGQKRLVFSGVGGDVFTNAGADVPAAGGAVAVWGSRVLGDSSSPFVVCPTEDGDNPKPAQPGDAVDPAQDPVEHNNGGGMLPHDPGAPTAAPAPSVIVEESHPAQVVAGPSQHSEADPALASAAQAEIEKGGKSKASRVDPQNLSKTQVGAIADPELAKTGAFIGPVVVAGATSLALAVVCLALCVRTLSTRS